MSNNWIQIRSRSNQIVNDTNFSTRRINFEMVNSMNMDYNHELVVKITQFPLGFTASNLKEIFSCFGEIETIFVPKKRKISERYAYIKFGGLRSTKFALIYDPINMSPTLFKNYKLQGIKKWLIKYKSLRPNPRKLQILINQFMDVYDKKLEQDRKAEQKRKEKEENEGWTLVVSKKRATNVKQANLTNLKNRVKKNIYKETTRLYEKKSLSGTYLDLLRKRFKEDKMKIKRLRMKRKIKI